MMRSRQLLQIVAALPIIFASSVEWVAAAESGQKLPACKPVTLKPFVLPTAPPPAPLQLRTLSPAPPLPSVVPLSSPLRSGSWMQTKAKAKLLAKIAQHYAVAGQSAEARATLESAIKVVQSIDPRPSRTTNRLLNVNTSYPKANALVDLVEQITHPSLKREAKHLLLSALQVARSIEAKGWQSRTLDRIAQQFARLDEVATAQQIAQSIPDSGRRVRTLRQLAVNFAADGQWQAARQIIPMLEAATNNDFNYEWQQLTLTLAREGNSDRALEAVKAFPAKNQDYFLGELARKLMQRKQFEAAQQAGGAIANPNIKMWSLLRLAQQAGREGHTAIQNQSLAAALETARAWEEPVFKKTSLLDVAKQFVAINQTEKALPVLAEALQLAQAEQACHQRARSLQRIAHLYVAAGQNERADAVLSQALEDAQKVRSQARKGEILLRIGGAALKRGNPQQADALFAEALKTGTSADRQVVPRPHRDQFPSMQHSIAIYYAEAGQVETALELLDRLPQGYSAAALRHIFSALLENGYAADGVEVIKRMNRPVARTWALKQINLKVASRQILEQTLPLYATIKNLRLRQSSLGFLSQDLARAGRFDDALRTVQAIQSSRVRTRSLQQISLEAAKQGNRSAALRAAYRLPAGFAQDSALSKAIVRLIEQDRAPQMLSFASKIQTHSERNIALAAIARHLAKTGQFSDAVAVAESLSNQVMKVETLTAIAAQLLAAGETDRALALLAQAKTAATAIKTESWRPIPRPIPGGRWVPPQPLDRRYPTPNR